MALIVITIADTQDGQVDIGLQSEPGIDLDNPGAMLTPAQVNALNMLQALKSEPVKEDRGLIQLLND